MHRRPARLLLPAVFFGLVCLIALSPGAPGPVQADRDRVDTPSTYGPAGDGPIPNRYFVTFRERRFLRPDEPDDRVEGITRDYGTSLRRRFTLLPDTVSMDIPDFLVQFLARDPRIAQIDPVRSVRLLDAELQAAWGVNQIGSGPVHDGGNKGAGVRVAVLDTGILKTHNDLNANYDPACSYDFIQDDTDPNDQNGHGTHVAGTVAAEDDGAGVVGVAPAAKICALRVLGANGSGGFDDIIAAIGCAATGCTRTTNGGASATVQKADIASLSLGSNSDPGSSVANAFANAHDAGLTIIAAAGNAGTCAGNTDTVGWPAKYADVIAVAATDSNNVAPCFSSTGPKLVSKGIAAPGVSVQSTWYSANNAYAVLSGTSMATPHVAGVAALILSTNPGYSPDQVWSTLRDSAIDLDNPLSSYPGTADGADTWYGRGLVQASAAGPVTPAEETHDVAITNVSASPSSVTVGSTSQISVTVQNQGNVTETNLSVAIADGALPAFATPVIASLDPGDSATVNANWTAAVAGGHTINADVTIVSGDTQPSDNHGQTAVTVTVVSTPVTISYKPCTISAAVTSSAGDNNGHEVNGANACADDGLFAVDNNSGTSSFSSSCTSSSKDKQVLSGFGISVPSGTVTGIQVRLQAKVDSTGSSTRRLCVQLSWNGTSWTTAKQTGSLTTSEATYTLGATTDTWGHTWTLAEIANLRVRVIDVANSTARDFSLDHVGVQVTYQP